MFNRHIIIPEIGIGNTDLSNFVHKYKKVIFSKENGKVGVKNITREAGRMRVARC